MDWTPEQLLGLAVVGPGGHPVGTVVDVGLATWRQPKFLLVEPARAPKRLVRLDFREVEVGEREVRIARPNAGLPA